MKRLAGLKSLVTGAVIEVTDLVQRTHRHAAKQQLQRLQLIAPIGQAAKVVDGVHMALADLVYDSVRAVTRGVDMGCDVVFELADDGAGGKAAPHEPLPRSLDTAQGALNGFFGDFLHRHGNPLDLGMSVLDGSGRVVEELAPQTRRIALFVHGLAITERCWSHRSEQLWGEPEMSFAVKLQRDLGYLPLFLRYNSGRHIAVNGSLLSAVLQKLLSSSSAHDLEQLVLIGHSMGGLVARSAAHQGRDDSWSEKLSHVFCIGSPHTGAPLEKATHLLASVLGAVDEPSTRAIEQVLQARSAGIKDLRHGDIVTYDPGQPVELGFLDHVTYVFIASTITRDPAHPLGQAVGDWLVRLPSATYAACGPVAAVATEQGQGLQCGLLPLRAVVGGIGHIDLVNHPDIYALIRDRLR